MDLELLHADPRRAGRARLPRQAGVGVGCARRARLRGDDRTCRRRCAAELAERVPFSHAGPSSDEARATDGTVKALFRTRDGRPVEAVLMRYRDGRRSLCLSSQSGCPLTCTFCATGAMKFGRNLTASEILDQALHFRRIGARRPRRVHGDGRADDEPRPRPRRLRAAARRRRHPPPHGDLHRRLDPGHRPPRPSPTCRSASRCRCTPPTRRCARSSCPSTTAIRWPTCSPPASASTTRKRRMVFVEYVMLAGVNDRYEQAAAARRRARPEDLQGQPDPVQPDRPATTARAARRSRRSRRRSRSTGWARRCG